MRRNLALMCGIGAALVMGGCSSMMKSSTSPSAVADLAPTKGNQTRGTVTFTQRGDRLQVQANVSGLSPGGHGFHVHEKGDCSADDARSAGGHYNPGGKPHGDPATAEHHAGDMPMLMADASGNARLDVSIAPASTGGSAPDIVGKAVIVHKDADDFKTQPTGNSGARVACGVIRRPG